MSELTLKLVIILIPGALATLILGKMILHKEWSNFKFILYSILFGVFSYSILQIIIEILNLMDLAQIPDLRIWSTLTDTKLIPYGEVIFSSFISIILGFAISFIENRKLLNRLAKKLGISNKYGDENLYSRFLNDTETQYIYLRDTKNNLTYYGWVKSFSENEIVSEIRLSEVSVYTYESSEHLYDIDDIYLSLCKTDIKIEKAIINT